MDKFNPGDTVLIDDERFAVISHRAFDVESSWICEILGEDHGFSKFLGHRLRKVSPLEELAATALGSPRFTLADRAAAILSHGGLEHETLAHCLGADPLELFEEMWMDKRKRFCGLPVGDSNEWWLRRNEDGV